MTGLLRMLVISAVTLALAAPIAHADNIRFGVAAEPYPPFSWKDASGNWVGWEIDLMNAVCRKMKDKCELVEVPWEGIIPALLSNKVDVVWSSLAITNERKKTIDFTDLYFRSTDMIIAPKDKRFDPNPEGLRGKVLGVQISTTNEKYARKYFGSTVKEIKAYQTQDEANNDLAAGRLDAVEADSLALSIFLETEQGRACCVSMGYVADDPEILGDGTGGGIRKEDNALKAKLNAAIRAVIDSGEIQKITEQNHMVGRIILPQ